MKSFFLAFVVVLSVGGCCAPNKAFVDAVESSWKVMGPEYIQYIEADPNLAPETKVTRKRTADGLTEKIAQAQAAQGVTP